MKVAKVTRVNLQTKPNCISSGIAVKDFGISHSSSSGSATVTYNNPSAAPGGSSVIFTGGNTSWRVLYMTIGSANAWGNVTTNSYPVTPGEVFTVSYYCKNASPNTFQIRRAFANADLTSGTAIHYTVPGSGSTTDWQRVSLTFTVPANMAYMALHTERGTSSGSDTTWEIGGILIEKTNTLQDYFDGSSTNARWTGTPRLSTSELIGYVDATTKVYNGSSFQDADVKRYNGTSWVPA